MLEEKLLSPEQERLPSPSPDVAVASASLPFPEDYCQFQDLLCRVGGELHVPLEEIQNTQHKLMNIFHSSVPGRVAVPINDSWNGLAYAGHIFAYPQGGRKMLLCTSQEVLSFFCPSSPDSLVVQTVTEQARHQHSHSTPSDREGKC